MRILTIDGGGAKGYVSSEVIRLIEELYGVKFNKHFHLIAGTSAGSITAGCLAMQMTGTEISNLFKEKILRAFAAQQSILKWPRTLMRKHIYAIEPFMESLVPYVGDTKLKDVPVGLFLTARDVVENKMLYYVNRGPGASKYGDLRLQDIIRASSAAPIYFPPHLERLVDGGVGLDNNPIYKALVEAFEYIGPEEGYYPGNVKVLSIGTGETHNRLESANMWLMPNIAYLISVLMDTANKAQTEQALRHYGDKAEILRINPDISASGLKLDSHKEAEARLMEAIAEHAFIQNRQAIDKFFND